MKWKSYLIIAPHVCGYIAGKLADLMLVNLSGILCLDSIRSCTILIPAIKYPFSFVPSGSFLVVKDDGGNNMALVELTRCIYLVACILKLST